MIDENAFGILVAPYDLENAEYSMSPEELKTYLDRWRRQIVDGLQASPLGEPLRMLDFGHAIYLEVGDGDQLQDPFDWLRCHRQALAATEVSSIGVLAYGARWLTEPDPTSEPSATVGQAELVWEPSEPLRKAMAVETRAQPNLESEAAPGWGSGLYVERDAIEALGKKLKNAPTEWLVPGGRFYRLGL